METCNPKNMEDARFYIGFVQHNQSMLIKSVLKELYFQNHSFFSKWCDVKMADENKK